ncbi:hypothetical protein E1211_30515 [Micromonospora sp. 15K316]|uniref:hypothetical protein n=1 Tax=Micromonospora sp. 15K316 TaxID=2530376 RepID=UPI0010475C39|nr:hypothetical protein [Micromonospora sp. 15K316]TDC25941.1 hypothetical protein E1211_30515 [Micromonospora sp. 15K316]
MTDLKPGEHVNITIENATIVEVSRHALAINLPGTEPNGVKGFITINPNREGVDVTRVAPAEWPPIQGDLWRDAYKTLWFVYRYESGIGTSHRVETRMTSASENTHSGSMSPDRLLSERGPVTLVHREYPDPDDVED